MSRHVAKTSGSDVYGRKRPNQQGLFGTLPQEPWHPGKDAKPDRVIQLNRGEVRTHASYKATRTWENFNNRGTKIHVITVIRRVLCVRIISNVILLENYKYGFLSFGFYINWKNLKWRLSTYIWLKLKFSIIEEIVRIRLVFLSK